MPAYELNLRDYWRIIKKKKVIVVTTIVMLSSFSLIFAIMNKPTPVYQAVSSLKIEQTGNIEEYYYSTFSWGAGDALATRSEEIKSYPMIEKAAQIMGRIPDTLSTEEIRNNQHYFNITTALKTKVRTEQEGYTNIINVIVTSSDPIEARDLANALANIYEEESFKEKNKTTTDQFDAIRAQLDKAEKALKESQQKVKNYREQHRAITLSGAETRLMNQLNMEID